jgi:preprotein translocase subunit SecA
MGQRDPLNEWQREGYEMFVRMMGGINDDYLRYVMHAEVVIEAPEQPSLEGAQYKAAEETVQRPQYAAPVADLTEAWESAGAAQQPQPDFDDPNYTMAPVVKSEHDKVGRNEPCWCGSGKKFKHCHGQ